MSAPTFSELRGPRWQTTVEMPADKKLEFQANPWNSNNLTLDIVYRIPLPTSLYFRPEAKGKIPYNHTTYIYWLSVTKNATHYIFQRLGLSPANNRMPVFLRYQEKFKNDKAKKFMIIRDPFERAISSYLELLKLREDTSPTHFLTQMTDFYNMRENLLASFCKFLEELQLYGFYDIHTHPQIKLLTDLGLTIDDMDTVILFDNLQDELEDMCKAYHIPLHDHEVAMGQFINKGDPIKKAQLKQYIEEHPKIRKVIANLYPQDYEIYRELKLCRKR